MHELKELSSKTNWQHSDHLLSLPNSIEIRPVYLILQFENPGKDCQHVMHFIHLLFISIHIMSFPP